MLPPDSPVISPEPRLLAGGRGSLYGAQRKPRQGGASSFRTRAVGMMKTPPVLICR
jgi:hypothetical protein